MKMKQKLEKTLGEPKSNKFDWYLEGWYNGKLYLAS